MSIRFAAAHALAPLRSNPRARACAMRLASNDNRASTESDAMLHAALRHFASHGLAAALKACEQAEMALEAKDRAAFLWWVDICRLLDRRMAEELERQASRPNECRA